MALVALTFAALLAVSFAVGSPARLSPPEPMADKGQPEDLQASTQGRQGVAERAPMQGQQGFPQRPPGQQGFPQRQPGQQGFPQRPPITDSNAPQSMPQPHMRQGRQFYGGFVAPMGMAYGGYGRYSGFGSMGGMGMGGMGR